MCGITIYKGNPVSIYSIFNSVLKLKHRGDDDGFGYIDCKNREIVKSILTLEEVEKGELDTIRDDKKKTLKKLEKRLIEIKEGMKKETDYIIMHNRKASCGSVCIENTHPINIKKNVYYVHNGSIDGYELLKTYIEIENKVKFKSDTDTELLGWYVENEIEKGTDLYDIYNKLLKLFYNFGVLIRYDIKTNKTIIFKDIDRSLYYYKENGNSLFISEPLFSIKEFDKCYRIKKGIIVIDDKIHFLSGGRYVDVKSRMMPFLDKEVNTIGCDNCKSSSETVRTEKLKDYCLSCITSGKKLFGIDEDAKEDNKVVTTFKRDDVEFQNKSEWEDLVTGNLKKDIDKRGNYINNYL